MKRKTRQTNSTAIVLACLVTAGFNSLLIAPINAEQPVTGHSEVAPHLESVTEGEKLFALHVQPLFAERCLACHGADPDEIEGGLDLRSRDRLLAGGDAFESDVLIEGEGEHSMLFVTVTRQESGYEMPPKEADRLTEEQQWWIRDWINAGAPWPNEERVKQIQQAYAQGEQVLVSRALSDDWQNRRYESEKLWAYRPIESVEVPPEKHPIDWFIDQQLERVGLAVAPAASAQTLVRRLSYGLTGLPPTPDQVERFTNNFANDPQATIAEFSRHWMSTPQYGEHFGWRWLDVARYADTAGFANDYARPNAWRYRDYVVRAFNDDKPYNDFVREQIAGDEIDPDNVENLIATGFVRMGPWEQTGMSVFKETRGQWLDDVTDTVGQAFLAHSMLCCKCHDHKFDPIPTRDYYRMMAVFSTTQFAERDASFLDRENCGGFERSDAWIEAKVAAYEKEKKALEDKVERLKKQESGEAKVGDNGLDPGDEASLARISKNIVRHRIELDRVRPLALSVYTGATILRKNVQGRLDMPANPWGKGEIENDVIHTGGDVYAVGDAVEPGALSAAESVGQMSAIEFPIGKGKRRLALADWIVDPSNPLTSRVIVNRVWSWHFGKGIAANPNNFGGTGGLPTHRELLDYLAAWFMDNGWSIKKLNELIVTSDAFARSSRHPDPDSLAEKDPLGELYATFLPRRLTAEELRDSMLFVSGELNDEVGGIPCRPDLNLEVAFQPRQIMGGTASVYEPDPTPRDRNRRTLYAERIRGMRDPFMEAFNQPGPDKSCEMRETSIVAPQALTLINSQEVLDRAVAFADRIVREEYPDDEAAITRAFELAFSRTPTPEELTACVDHWRRAVSQEKKSTHEAKIYRDKIERTVMAEKTGKPYTFVEEMPAYTTYQPDLTLDQVDARTRGLAHVLLVLLNTNEFCYVD
ncbi:PSD1 and planctomycete cytochrome C domain-containing protein [Neorhodopirellula pilleata]|uniref:Planctomycete cytochrome C n=1 Tax=Neorhodopirellula pilleata TaxID=2714738 RepID=A0A5C6AQJ6_9BACT|nr:PSD1 and planctomycete cytochrome C domain-containing protein [Neorhodopirellula pilleata]TWU01828.1 Planctomycete cytochrome C [Neorhodopirellula pilleata]